MNFLSNEKTFKIKLNEIKESTQLSPSEKIEKLNSIKKQLNNCNIEKDEYTEILENSIEDIFLLKLRVLNEIRDQNMEFVKLHDIGLLKDGFNMLFNLIDSTLQWNPEMQNSLEGIINRASLRAMLIDPQVSVKQKNEIMDNWEDFM